MTTTRTIGCELFGAWVELDQRVRLLFAGNQFEPPDWSVETTALRVNDQDLQVQRYPALVRAVEIGGKPL